MPERRRLIGTARETGPGWRQRAGGEMFQRGRMILKRCVPVGLTGMAGVARLGEQAEVGEAEFPNQRPPGGRVRRPGTPRRIRQGQAE